MRSFLKICSLILLFGVLESKAFNYKNATKWGEEYPECKGRSQSPINIANSKKFRRTEYERDLEFTGYHTEPETMRLVNDGHSLKLLFTWPDESKPYITGGSLRYDQYLLDHFQLHWGASDNSGSEHTINGKGGALGIQFVHRNNKCLSYSDCLDKKDGLAIVAAIYYPSELTSSVGLFRILDAIDHPMREGDEINIDPVIPLYYFETFMNQQEYFTYRGSLTTPPCSEIVTWLVAKPGRGVVGSQQMEILRQFVELHDGDDHNNRPVQPLNKRKVHLIITKIDF